LKEALSSFGRAPAWPCASVWGAMRRMPRVASGMGVAWVWVRRQPVRLSP